VRKLASIRKITDILPIENADAIEVAVVDGWSVVTKKGEYQPGDLAVYFEIDSFVPEHLAPFLTKGNAKAKEYEGIIGNRLRTVKLRGQVSQGLLLGLRDPNVYKALLGLNDVYEGLDVTEQLGIVKYEPPIPACLAGEVEGMFPGFISKTDQERVQNLIGFGPKFFVGDWEVTLKLDGSSMTLFVRDHEVGVCSRNLHLKDNDANDGNTLVKFAREVNYTELLTEVAEAVGFDFALQGEIMGPGIQKNREKFAKHRFFVFDVYNISESRYCNVEQRKEVLDIINIYAPQIEHVPVIFSKFTVTEDNADLDMFLRMAERPSINHKIAEGIVWKNLNNGDKSFKVISNYFLLKEE
jgi:RNA ligase (TIGR02306 family)